MQRSRCNGDTSLYTVAERAYRRALEMDPAHCDAMVGLAWVENSRHHFEAGDNWSQRALGCNPQSSQALALLSDAAVERGDYESALEYLQRALDLEINLATLSRSAHVLWLLGDQGRAQQLMRQAIQAGGDHPENTAWCQAKLAQMALHQGNLTAAELLCQDALKHAPNHQQVLNAAGSVALAKNETAKAQQLFNQSLLGGANHTALNALVELALIDGDLAAAERYTNELLHYHGFLQHQHAESNSAHETLGTHGASHHHHSMANAELARFLADHDRDLGRALEIAREAYAEYPNIHTTDTLAWCYFKVGDYAKASEYIQVARRWQTPDATLIFHAGMIQAKLGHRYESRKLLYQALNLNPNFHPRFARQAVGLLAPDAMAQ